MNMPRIRITRTANIVTVYEWDEEDKDWVIQEVLMGDFDVELGVGDED